MPSMETSVALDVCHVRVADWHVWMVSGLTEMEAVGDGGGGGGGGGGGAAFFLQAPSIRIALNAIMVASVLTVCCVRLILFIFISVLLISNLFTLVLFTFDSSCEPDLSSSSSNEVFLFPTHYYQLQFGCELRPVKVN